MTTYFDRDGVTYLKQTLVADGELTQVCLEMQEKPEPESLEPEDES
jgi:hypothetical protein